MSNSPSSFAKGPRCGSGSRSRTSSDGRQSFTPHGVITIGRLIGRGCASTWVDEVRTVMNGCLLGFKQSNRIATRLRELHRRLA